MLCEPRLWKTTIDAQCYVKCIKVYLSMLQVAVIVSGMKGFLYPILLSQTEGFHYTIDPWKQPGLEKKEP